MIASAIDPAYQIVLERLSNLTQTDLQQWTCRCPAHEDSKNSLAVSIGNNGGMLFHCHAGCQTLSIVNALRDANLRPSDILFPLNRQKAKADSGSTKFNVIATYDYTDEQGKLLFQVCRLDPKDFRQRRPDGNGWVWSIKGVRQVLYRLPSILAADPSTPIFLCEGEKDVDNVTAVGLLATTNAGGAAKWLPEFNEHFRDRHVVILPDNDEAGEKRTKKLVASIQPIAASVKILNLSGPSIKDVSDWLAAGGTKEQLIALVDQCEVCEATPPKEYKPNEADDDPHRLARCFVQNCYDHVDHARLVRHREEYHAWRAASFCTVVRDDLSSDLTESIKDEFDRLNVLELQLSGDGAEKPEAMRVSKRLIGDTLNALNSIIAIPSDIEPPAWLGEGQPPFPLEECIFTQNAVVHLPSYVMGLKDHRFAPTPLVFNTSALGCDFNPEASRPDNWFSFLDSIWGDDEESKQALQEWMGYCLTNDTRHQKIMLAVGPKRSGKGTIARVMTALLGKSNVAGPTLSSLATNFGLSPLIGKPLAIVSDARLSSRTDAATITERLLSISGEDAITIDRKFATPVTVRLPTRFMILTNEIPRLGDASGALASRFVILSMTKSWLGAEDKRLEKKLLAELSSILLWAIQGWDNLNRQERFTEPKNSQQIVEEMEDLASPVAAFVRDCCNVGQGHNVATTDLYDAWKDYCEEHGKLKVSDERVFGRDLRATTPEINKERIRIGGHRMIRYLGIGLRNENEY